jgi:hypothetical protein
MPGLAFWFRADRGIIFGQGAIPVTATGTAPPAVTISGDPDAPYEIQIVVTTGGTPGAGAPAFQWSINGGADLVQTGVLITVGMATTGFALGATGLTAFFPTAAYTADNVFAAECVVTQAQDQAASGDLQHDVNQVLVSSEPQYMADDPIFGGMPSVGPFTAGSLKALRSNTWQLPLAQSFTIFVIGTDGAVNNQCYLDGLFGGECEMITRAGQYAVYAGTFLLSGVALAPGAHMWGFLAQGITSKAFVDARTATATGNAGLHGMTGLTLGNAYDGSEASGGKLAEVVVCRGALSQANIDLLGDYFAARYSMVIGA